MVKSDRKGLILTKPKPNKLIRVYRDLLTLSTRKWHTRHTGDPDWSLILLWFTQCTYTDPHRPSPPALTLCGEEVAVGTLATATLWRQKPLTFPHSSSLRSPPLQDGEGDLGDDFGASQLQRLPDRRRRRRPPSRPDLQLQRPEARSPHRGFSRRTR